MDYKKYTSVSTIKIINRIDHRKSKINVIKSILLSDRFVSKEISLLTIEILIEKVLSSHPPTLIEFFSA